MRDGLDPETPIQTLPKGEELDLNPPSVVRVLYQIQNWEGSICCFQEAPEISQSHMARFLHPRIYTEDQNSKSEPCPVGSDSISGVDHCP